MGCPAAQHIYVAGQNIHAKGITAKHAAVCRTAQHSQTVNWTVGFIYVHGTDDLDKEWLMSYLQMQVFELGKSCQPRQD